MKMIKPVVNISKIADSYDMIICGLNGVIYDGATFYKEAIEALLNLRRQGKKVVLLSNTSMRLQEVINLLYSAGISPRLFNNIVTMGEILHHKLKSPHGIYAELKRVYYNLGDENDSGIFDNLNFMCTSNPMHADFMYIGKVAPASELSDYMKILSHSVSLDIPLLCVGNDTSAFVDGEICSAGGAVAAQYAALGGNIITLGKPELAVMNYVLEDYAEIDKSRMLMIGDSVSTDIKAANAVGIASLLVSKGIHVNFLGEGYIPDVTKTRELAANAGAFPDYVISNLRW